MAAYNTIELDVLERRTRAALLRLISCDICPRRCHVNRFAGELGFCRIGRRARVASYSPHFGEENCLVGTNGSGTIFFSGCNMSCVYCQNHEISQQNQGTDVSESRLAEMMLELEKKGCHNINFVTPTHVVPQILEALLIARKMGLTIPLVYNSGGYDSVDTLLLLDNIFDIYMPDAKYGIDRVAEKYSSAKNYTKYMKAAIREMHRQVGGLIQNENKIAVRGLIVRHLILPRDLAKSYEVIRFLSEEISPDVYLNIMPQYRPMYRADIYEELRERSVLKDYVKAIKLAADLGRFRGIGNP